MKSRMVVLAVAVSASLMVSSCDRVKKLVAGDKPTGQVVATVDGEEITSLELRAELGGFGSRDPAVMKAAQQQALQRIILRRLLAQEARREKLDKGADYTLQVDRYRETLLAQLYQRKLASKIAPPTKQQAQDYVSANPTRFAERKVLVVDQVIAAPNKIAPDRLRPLKTLGEVKTLLDEEGVPYQQNAAVFDTLTADPRLLSGILALPDGEIFVIPQGGRLLFNQITGSRSVPLTGDVAVNYAQNVLRQQRAGETVGKQIEGMRKAAENKITYNPAFKPAPPKTPSKAASLSTPTAAGQPAAPAPAVGVAPDAK